MVNSGPHGRSFLEISIYLLRYHLIAPQMPLHGSQHCTILALVVCAEWLLWLVCVSPRWKHKRIIYDLPTKKEGPALITPNVPSSSSSLAFDEPQPQA